MVSKPKFTVAEVLAAIPGSRGIKAQVARKLGCDWDTVNNYCHRHPTIAQAMKHEGQLLVDDAEAQLALLVSAGDWRAVKFTLQTRGRDRGYVMRTELDMTPRQIAEELAAELGIDLETVLARADAAARRLVP